MMFSSHMDMIFNNSALQDIFVKFLFIEYRLSKKIPLEKVRVGTFQQWNSFRIYYKGGKA